MNQLYKKGIEILKENGFIGSEFDGIEIIYNSNSNGIDINKTGSELIISVANDNMFYRAIALSKLQLLKNAEDFSLTENKTIKSIGVQINASCNAVPSVEALKRFIMHIALMGVDTIYLYIPDMFDLDDEPYFGYMRGKYSDDELKGIINFAKIFGISLIPSIEVLCNMDCVTRWNTYITTIWEHKNTLLCDDEHTYVFLEKIISKMSALFSSDTINIGIDHSNMLGFWKHKHVYGYAPREEILKRHLSRVSELCKKHGFNNIIWDEQFYMKKQDYKTISNIVPDDMILVLNPSFCNDCKVETELLQNKRFYVQSFELGNGFTPEIQKGINMAFEKLTVLKDDVEAAVLRFDCYDGAECSWFTSLPVLQSFAEIAFSNNTPDIKQIEENLFITSRIILSDFLLLDNLNFSEKLTAKSLLHQAVDNGLLCENYFDGAEDYYNDLYTKFAKLTKDENWEYLFLVAETVCLILKNKANLTQNLHKAYLDKDKEKLKELSNIIDSMALQVKGLRNIQREQWERENKPYGFDALDLRYGGLIQRLKTMSGRIKRYLSGELNELPELCETILPYNEKLPHKWFLIATTVYLSF